jgi:tetratricopeptide (TPR) repeat protein
MTVLNTVPFLYLNSTREENIKRVQSFVDDRIMPYSGQRQAAAHLSNYYSYQKPKHIDDRIALWQRFRNKYPNDSRGYQELIYALSAATEPMYNRIDQAFRDWYLVDPNNKQFKRMMSDYAFRAGEIHYHAGYKDTAARYYSAAVQYDTTLLPAYINLGNIMIGRQRYDAAVTYLRRALSLDSANVSVYFALATSYYKLGDLGSALTTYRLAARHHPDNGVIHDRLARLYELMDDNHNMLQERIRAAQLGHLPSQDILKKEGKTW